MLTVLLGITALVPVDSQDLVVKLVCVCVFVCCEIGMYVYLCIVRINVCMVSGANLGKLGGEGG